MLGGKEEPCVNRTLIKRIQETHADQNCPRVELSEENEESGAAELAILGARAGLDHPLWAKLFDVYSEGLDSRQKKFLMWRAVGALSDPDNSARIKAARDRAVRDASAKGR
ncbi:MAG: hypothetical protein ACRD1B_02545 [Thermoanaerobaculia bacterium]